MTTRCPDGIPDDGDDSRDDPHAQSRAARHQPLLLHSLAVFRELFDILFSARTIDTVIEIGVESGQVSGMCLELGAAAVYCVDPAVTHDLRAVLATDDRLQLVAGHSPDVLAQLPLADLYVLDGDHNYATVAAELDWILTHAPDAIVVVHDVGWPWSRRDLYYEPSPLPAHDRHPASAAGPTIWHDELTPAGFVGAGAFRCATHAGGERNGVRTAVEDALTRAPDAWSFEVVPAVFGLGILVRRGSPAADALNDDIHRYSSSQLLQTLENNRIALYTRVLQLQFEAVAAATNTDRLADTITEQQHTIEQLQTEQAAAEARHAADLAARDQHIQALQHQLAQASPPPNGSVLSTCLRTLRRRHRDA